MNELIQYIENLLKNPEDFHLSQHTHEAKLQRILDHYADERPPTVKEMIKLLRETYPALESNATLIEKGNELRSVMMERVFAEDFQPAEADKFDAQMKLFDKLVNYNATINQLMDSVTGASQVTKTKSSRGKSKVHVTDTQGAAQRIMAEKEIKDGEEQ